MISPFFAEAHELRTEFERRVGPSRSLDPARFVWDYWHVPGQYSYLRTPAHRFFPAPLYGRLLARIRAWGTATLGCAAVSDPWLSYYLDGGGQELHADVPQGPWSYVYSLTRDAGFTGGETMLLRTEILDYWTGFDAERPRERDDLLHRISSEFDQLVVFDSRVPHGVSTVRGTMDPLRSRVVLHGWFRPPALTVRGGLRPDQIAEPAAALSEHWAQASRVCGPLSGVAVWEVAIDPDGSASPRPLTGTLVATAHSATGPQAAIQSMTEALARTRFPPAAQASTVLFPVSSGSR
ncbi:MAG TPA: 2OG-Fe(II) oxygenase [Jatrophihabitans sp.]